MLERPWPIVLPMATLPAVAAICAIIPGCLVAPAAAAAPGWGTGAEGAWPGTGGAAVLEALRVWVFCAGAEGRAAGRERD